MSCGNSKSIPPQKTHTARVDPECVQGNNTWRTEPCSTGTVVSSRTNKYVFAINFIREIKKIYMYGCVNFEPLVICDM
jgi:hypothetical protein